MPKGTCGEAPSRSVSATDETTILGSTAAAVTRHPFQTVRNPMAKTALITGITRQDGSYLANCPWTRAMWCTASSGGPAASTPTGSTPCTRIPMNGLVLHYGDLTDSTNLIRIIQQIQPDNL